MHILRGSEHAQIYFFFSKQKSQAQRKKMLLKLLLRFSRNTSIAAFYFLVCLYLQKTHSHTKLKFAQYKQYLYNFWQIFFGSPALYCCYSFLKTVYPCLKPLIATFLGTGRNILWLLILHSNDIVNKLPILQFEGNKLSYNF